MNSIVCVGCGKALSSVNETVCKACGEEQPTRVLNAQSTTDAVADETADAATLAGIQADTDPQALPTCLPSPTVGENAAAIAIFARPVDGEGLGSYFHPRQIGQWKFGTIVAASHPHLQREAMLFVLADEHAGNDGLRQWFMASARKLASIQNPHVAATVLEAVNSAQSTFVAIAKRDVQSLDGMLAKFEQEVFQSEGDALARHFHTLFSGLESLHKSGVAVGAIGPDSLGRIPLEDVLVLLPCKDGFPGEAVVTDMGDPILPISTSQQRDYRQLAAAFLQALVSGESRKQFPASITRADVRKRLPLMNPGLARLLVDMTKGGPGREKLPAMHLQLDLLSRQSLRPANWSDRIGTLMYDFAVFWSVSFVLVMILALLYAGTGMAAVSGFGIALTAWLGYFLLVSEPLFDATPGRKLRGLFLARVDGAPLTHGRLFARSLARLAAWIVLTALFAVIVQLTTDIAPSRTPGFSIDYGVLFLLPMSGVGILAVYATGLLLHGQPVHDWLTGVRLVRYVSEESTAQQEDALTRPARPSVAEFQSDHREGVTIDQYRLGGELGRGGMGAVHHAWDTVLGRQVAVKVITAASVADREALTRFEREAKLVAKLDHPNIANVYGVGTWDGQPYMAMEYVAGQNFRELTDDCGPLPVAAAWDLITQAARGIGHASQRGIVHRDIKPSNLMVTSSGTVKVMDFGISKGLSEESDELPATGQANDLASTVVSVGQLAGETAAAGQSLTQTGAVMGTPQYMSPEQARGERLDTRSDIYSLGLSLYCLLAGKPPFASTEFYDLLVKQCNEPPPPLPKALLTSEQQAVLDRMLAKDPDQRYQDFSSLVSALTETAPQPLRLAPVSARIGAMILDGLVGYALSAVLQLSGGLFISIEHPVVPIVASVLSCLGFLSLLKVFGWTPGKWLLKMRVRPLRGKQLSWRQASIRYFAKWPNVPVAVLLLAFASQIEPSVYAAISGGVGLAIVIYYCIEILVLSRRVDRRTLHDLAAGTHVVQLPGFRAR